uniref:Uncharacterized protein n=1 Tax=Biomphalaria glabrata TaxID=6526 RepID=A0A2C9L2K9_BIOGL
MELITRCSENGPDWVSPTTILMDFQYEETFGDQSIITSISRECTRSRKRKRSTSKKRISVPTPMIQKKKRTLKQRIVDRQERYLYIPKKPRLELTDEDRREATKLGLLQEAVHVMCLCKAIMRSIMAERPGLALSIKRACQYKLFIRIIDLMNEFNLLIKALVKLDLNINIILDRNRENRTRLDFQIDPV